MPIADIMIRTPDGECRAKLVKPKGEGPWPGVIVFMDAPGWRPTLFEIGQRIADMGHVVLVPDVFYRHAPYPDMDFSTPPEALGAVRSERLKWVGEMAGNAKLKTDVPAFVAALRADSDVKSGPFGATGYCMGGRMAIASCALWPEDFAAAGSFHGGGLATDHAESVHLALGRVKGKLLIAGATDDPYFNDAEKTRLKTALDASGCEYDLETWPAAHGWTMKDLPVYDRAQSERHLDALETLFAQKL